MGVCFDPAAMSLRCSSGFVIQRGLTLHDVLTRAASSKGDVLATYLPRAPTAANSVRNFLDTLVHLSDRQTDETIGFVLVMKSVGVVVRDEAGRRVYPKSGKLPTLYAAVDAPNVLYAALDSKTVAVNAV